VASGRISRVPFIECQCHSFVCCVLRSVIRLPSFVCIYSDHTKVRGQANERQFTYLCSGLNARWPFKSKRRLFTCRHACRMLSTENYRKSSPLCSILVQYNGKPTSICPPSHRWYSQAILTRFTLVCHGHGSTYRCKAVISPDSASNIYL